MSAEAETMDDVVRRYQWYTGYSRDQEYDKDPQWAVDMRSKVVDEQSNGAFSNETVKFYDRFDPEHMWIKSDTTHELTKTL